MTNLISVGGYGCVYKPALTCSGNFSNDETYISKLQVNNDSAKNEISIGKKLKKYSNFFVIPEESCEIKKEKLKKEDCPLIKENENLLLIKMKYIPHKSFFDLLTEDSCLGKQIYTLLYNYSALLKSLNILRKNGIIHYDLKLDNILYDFIEQYPKIIDFGISIEKNKISLHNLKKTFWTYAPWYYIWSPDIHFLCLISNINPSPTLKDIEVMMREYMKNNEVLLLLDKKTLTEYELSYVEYFSRFIGKSPKEVGKELLMRSNNWDIFSLTLVFIKLEKFLTTKNNIKHPFFSFFTDILMKSISPFSEDHLSEEEILSKLYSYLREKKVKSTTRNNGFTKKYIKSIKQFHKSRWSDLENKLINCSIKN